MKRTVIAISLAVFLAASFPSANAGNVTGVDYSTYSISQLTELITQLTKQLEEMKKSSSVACFVSERDLTIGDGETGDGYTGDVERLQAFLREKGYFTFHKNTGFFGKVTRTALLAFQEAEGLSATGEFDVETRAKMHSMHCEKTTSSAKKTETTTAVKKETEKIEKTETKKTETKEHDKTKTESVKKETTSTTSSVTAIEVDGDGAHVRWAADGFSKHGFKIVWSKTEGPTYPTRDGDQYIYLSNPASTATTLTAFDGAGTYYVRVCEYLGGACGLYSNQITVELEN